MPPKKLSISTVVDLDHVSQRPTSTASALAYVAARRPRLIPLSRPGSFEAGKRKAEEKKAEAEYGGGERYCKRLCARLWEDKLYTDCTVVAGEQEFRCHRSVLAAASPVFERMLASGMQEAVSGRIEIKDVKPDVVSAMLQFCYVGDLQPQVDGQHVEMLLVADRFEMLDLIRCSASTLLNSLTTENATQIARVLRSKARHKDCEGLWTSFLAKVRSDPEILRATLETL